MPSIADISPKSRQKAKHSILLKQPFSTVHLQSSLCRIEMPGLRETLLAVQVG